MAQCSICECSLDCSRIRFNLAGPNSKFGSGWLDKVSKSGVREELRDLKACFLLECTISDPISTCDAEVCSSTLS